MKRKMKTLTFTILSNDANKVVTRFQLPRKIVYIVSFIAIIPIILSFYFFNETNQKQQMNNHLAADLTIQTNKVDGLQTKVDSMKQKTAKVQAKMKELKLLESQMRESMTELPVSLGPSGGIDIQIPENELKQSEFVKHYKKTIDEMEQTNKELKHTPTIWPSSSHSISSEFGPRSDPFNRSSSLHTGIDIRGSTGTPVFAGADGTVTLAEYYGGYGKTIKVRHSDRFVTLYSHLSEIKVKQGDTLKKGDNIGSIGSTGRSTGPHLHYEILENGKPVDPYPYMTIFNK
ncbi:M23 family metallopeptidase [Virgibacillus litoralis]|uniref:Murein DD-endopeptidase MepM/ murein hydrolase activator NlpD n=1 Tax=Virgibacillus litoralis TaxID=578221 RepID=A0ABS4HEM2_9BACI|nr:M23 family metallopeptidase [Virgibacillus litoralis]MBP1949303.1 murein DD-endopeptidase MepM/ murein hydrolase activator NlpD [Virgibacillus litoralis]